MMPRQPVRKNKVPIPTMCRDNPGGYPLLEDESKASVLTLTPSHPRRGLPFPPLLIFAQGRVE